MKPRNVQNVGAAALCAELLYKMPFFGFEKDTVEAERMALEMETKHKSLLFVLQTPADIGAAFRPSLSQ